MVAMQYNISLPSDYNMDIIKKRVQNTGSKMDGFPGLKMKAYLIAEKAAYNNHENQYAPFYLWDEESGMNQFLLGGPFNNILDSFGRPIVHHWVVLYAEFNQKVERQFAAVHTTPIPASSDLTSLYQNEEEKFLRWQADSATTAYISAYNPASWELCHFHMTQDLDALQKTVKSALIYDVYHISSACKKDE